jgi:hypothetical protein
VLTLDYPGWRAEVDGRRVAVVPAEASGLITFQVPAGRHEVSVHFGSTTARSVGWVVSVIALIQAAAVSRRMEHPAGTHKFVHPQAGPSGGGNITHFCVYGIAALLYAAGGSLPRLMPEAFSIRSPRGVVDGASQPLPRALQGGVDLLAYDLPDTALGPGNALTVVLYWRAVRPDLPDYQVDLLIAQTDDSGNSIRVAQHRHPGMIPSSRWSAWPLLDYYVRDAYYVTLGRDLAPGQYQVFVQVGRCGQADLLPCATLEPLFVRDGRGSSLGTMILLPTTIEVGR